MCFQQGKLAKELDFVSHHVRTKLDELKRQEVSRLRTLIKAKQDIEGGNGTQTDTIIIQKISNVALFSLSAPSVQPGPWRREGVKWPLTRVWPKQDF